MVAAAALGMVVRVVEVVAMLEAPTLSVTASGVAAKALEVVAVL